MSHCCKCDFPLSLAIEFHTMMYRGITGSVEQIYYKCGACGEIHHNESTLGANRATIKLFKIETDSALDLGENHEKEHDG